MFYLWTNFKTSCRFVCKSVRGFNLFARAKETNFVHIAGQNLVLHCSWRWWWWMKYYRTKGVDQFIPKGICAFNWRTSLPPSQHHPPPHRKIYAPILVDKLLPMVTLSSRTFRPKSFFYRHWLDVCTTIILGLLWLLWLFRHRQRG